MGGATEGLPETDLLLLRCASKFIFTEGARDLVETLQANGWKVGVVSGGFHETVDDLARELGLDYVRESPRNCRRTARHGKLRVTLSQKEVKLASLKNGQPK